MADVLVTGATGLLGSRVVPSLAESHRVWALVREVPEDGPPDVCWVVHDLRRPTLPADLPARMDAVVHLAQAREFREFPARAPDTFRVNVASTALLLDFAVRTGARRFVLASTGGVYDPGPDPHHEDEPTRLDACPSFYVASKLAGEALTWAYKEHMGVCVLRPFFIYGHGQDESMLLPRLVGRIRARESIVLDGSDGMRFNPVHVSDAARAVIAALELQGSAVVNVAGPQVLSLREAVTELGAQLGARPQVTVRPSALPVDFVADTTRMAALLVPPQVTLAEGARELCSRELP